MGFISKNLDDVHEPEAAPESEYDLRIVKAKRGESKKGTPMITATIVIDEPGIDAPPFQHYLRDPGAIEDEDQARMAALEAKRFMSVFDLDEDFDEDDMPGQTGRCFVTQETGDDDVVRNRLRLPRLKE